MKELEDVMLDVEERIVEVNEEALQREENIKASFKEIEEALKWKLLEVRELVQLQVGTEGNTRNDGANPPTPTPFGGKKEERNRATVWYLFCIIQNASGFEGIFDGKELELAPFHLEGRAETWMMRLDHQYLKPN